MAEGLQAGDSPATETESSERRRAITVKAFALAVVLLVLANLWMKYAALVTVSAQVTMSVPPIPALMGLIALLALRSVLRPISGWFDLSRREMLFIYTFLTLSVALTSGGALREFMPELTALDYFSTPENNWAQYHDLLPSWMAPHDPSVIQGYYEGTANAIPWGSWLVPLASWAGFFMLLLGGLLCLALLLYDNWADSERLSFQVTELPLSMTAPKEANPRIPQLWSDPVMWIGFGLAALHNILNIMQAFNPAVTALGLSYPVGALFTERPLSALNDVIFHHRPEIVGFGYLMPQEIVVSSLIFYAMMEAEGVVAVAMGYDIPRFPHFESQAGGAFVMFALILLWMARHALAHQFRQAFTPGGDILKRFAVFGLLISLIGMWGWWRAAGMSTFTIVLFFGVVLLMAITYDRIRAQTGLPLQWGYPVSQSNIGLLAILGSKPFKAAGGVRNLTTLYTGWFLTRGYLPNLSAYHFEALHIGEKADIRRREIVITMLAAILLGVAISFYVQIDAYYTYGANFLEGGTHQGGMRVGAARHGFSRLEQAATSGIPPNRGETIAIIWGAFATFALTIIRHRFLRFPLHHLGFIIGTTRGYRAWGGLLIAAIVKSIAVRIGGVRLYRRLIPAAVGVVLGHFVVGGGIWSLIAVFGGEAYRGYQIWFG